MDQAVVSMVEASRPWRISIRRRRQLGRVTVISLWLHLTVLALFVVAVHYAPLQEEELPPPATVAMVFEGGSENGPTAPKPSLPNFSQPSPSPAPPPVPPVPPQAAAAPPPPAPAPPTVTPPAPAPAAPAPPTSEPAAELPVPPLPPVAMVIPPTPSPKTVQKPPAALPRPPPSNLDAFPAPTNYSLGGPLQRQGPRPATHASGRALRTFDFSLASRAGVTSGFPHSHLPGSHSEADWRNELSAWVEAHKYYPEQAAMNGEDGNVMVQVTANPDGRVTSVQMESRSGSQWLDMALMGMFRDANLPPTHEDEPITFHFTMHYILYRQ